jgi:hypothetical protein
MPIREELSATPVTLGEVLSNGRRYAVPPFQRDYAWDETEWFELWADIRDLGSATGDAGNHYLGALVLQPTGDRQPLNIIDGQQRLVTLSLLALAGIVRIENLVERGIEAEDNRERVRLLRERFVSTRDSASLQHHSRLELNTTDNAFYQTYLVQGRPPGREPTRGTSASRLLRAFQFFDVALAAHLGARASGSAIAAFLDSVIAERLRFISITVQNDETAFAVFETLNARGIALGTADLLKNFVFSVAAKGGGGDLDQAHLLWEQIVRVVPMPDVASLLFHRMAAVTPDLRERRVFSEVKKLVPGTKSVFDFLRELHTSADIYAALDDPNDEFWAPFPPDVRPSVRILSILGAVQYRPVILAAYDTFFDRPEKLARLLQNLVVIAVRAAVARVNTGDIQRANQAAALRIGRGELKSPASIARALADITPADDVFTSGFAALDIDPRGRQRRLLKYFLSELESAAGGQVDFDRDNVTIEHILPENPGLGWESFGHEDRVRDTTRLGNLTPLESDLNHPLGAAAFETKRAAYARSRFKLTQTIQATEWTPDAVRARQGALAKLAAGIWKVDLPES